MQDKLLAIEVLKRPCREKTLITSGGNPVPAQVHQQSLRSNGQIEKSAIENNECAWTEEQTKALEKP